MGPLQGVRVVQIASMAPAPFGCMMLSDLGAEVLTVERPVESAGITSPRGVFDRGQRSIEVDLKDPAGAETLLRLIEPADVLIEGFRPGATERLGIGPKDCHERNPKLIYGRMTGWGQEGPLAQRAGHDINYIALAGALEPMGRPGEPPAPPLNLIGDFAGGGLLLAMGIVSALFERERSGQGQVVDSAMVDGAGLLTSFIHGMHANGLWQEERGTNLFDGTAAFYDTYETADGKYVAVGCLEPHLYAELRDKLGLSGVELPAQFDLDAAPQLKQRIGAVFKSRTRDEWAEVFADSDACVTPVLSPWEAHHHEHHVARGSFVEVDGVRQPAPAPRFSRTPGSSPVPSSDDAAELLQKWGFGTDESAMLCTRNPSLA